MPPTPCLSERNRRALALLLIAGAAIRLVYYLQIKDGVLFRVPILDAGFYHRWALEIVSGDWLGLRRGVFYASPGQAYFLALLYAIFGRRMGAVMIAHGIAGLVTAWLIYLLGRRRLSPEAGVLGAIFYLFYAPAIFYEGTLLKAPLINLLNMAALTLASGGAIGAFGSGLSIGYSTHLRPTALFLSPLILFWLWRKTRRPAMPAIFMAGVMTVLLPAAARNYAVGREWVWTTAHGGMNLYTGNAPDTNGRYKPPDFTRANPEGELEDFLAEARRRTGRELTPVASSRFWYEETWRGIVARPGRWLKQLLHKALLFINAEETPINLDFDFMRRQYRTVLSLPLLGFGIIMPLALVGFMGGADLLLFGYLLLYLLSGVIFFVVSEYRFPIVPVLCLYAGAGLLQLARLPMLKRSMVLTAAGLACGGALLVNMDTSGLLFNQPRDTADLQANGHFNLGTAYEQEGNYRDAAANYRRALEAKPHLLALVNLAAIADRDGDTDRALAYLRQALNRWPNSSEAWNNLGAIYLNRLGDAQAALLAFRRAVSINPNFALARRNLARSEEQLRRRP